MPPSRRTTVAMQRDWTDGVPASPHPMPFPHAREGNLEPPLSTRERGGGEGFAGGVVGAKGAHATTPSASHPPLLEKEGSEAGLVILLGALSTGLALGICQG